MKLQSTRSAADFDARLIFFHFVSQIHIAKFPGLIKASGQPQAS